ncbi:hypothetical protein [Candidatus Hakubella thermalkaliphila]|uniref:hypothetical protein n=1 Tax=Candidatus Hakubella thermalkaliphila TaxID=2754717 RepID=UPI0015943EF9|nr:hypothetical protein [Candidatus Hakubella thermalkaliphila]
MKGGCFSPPFVLYHHKCPPVDNWLEYKQCSVALYSVKSAGECRADPVGLGRPQFRPVEAPQVAGEAGTHRSLVEAAGIPRL